MAEVAVTARADAIALAYHARSKHRRERYAPGPETIDWTMPPAPFRDFEGCRKTPLPLGGETPGASYADIFSPGTVPPAPLALRPVGLLLSLSMGLSAWKQDGPDLWSVRCTPSSGNLHPTEAYVVARGMDGLADGVHHYQARDHSLEHRFEPEAATGEAPGLWIGLSSIHWREAWKYGERAFRYCQLDIGHALGALRMAAGALGWSLRAVAHCDGPALARLLGLDREPDFAGVEREEPALLLQAVRSAGAAASPAMPRLGPGRWTGHASRIDPHPMYRWRAIGDVAAATGGAFADADEARPSAPPASPPLPGHRDANAARLILGRRSAQRFDAGHGMAACDVFGMLDALLVRDRAPWDVWRFAPRLHPVLFVHRVDGLAPGAYILLRRRQPEADLRRALDRDFLWERVDGAPAHLPLYRLSAGDCRKPARLLSCLQAIAADGCFSLGMLAEFAGVVANAPWRYRQLHWEAGLIGQLLYLEAEALHLRGTGIGCFFDDDVHAALGLDGTHFQTIYHFAVGRGVPDPRVRTLPPYPSRRTTSQGSKEE